MWLFSPSIHVSVYHSQITLATYIQPLKIWPQRRYARACSEGKMYQNVVENTTQVLHSGNSGVILCRSLNLSIPAICQFLKVVKIPSGKLCTQSKVASLEIWHHQFLKEHIVQIFQLPTRFVYHRLLWTMAVPCPFQGTHQNESFDQGWDDQKPRDFPEATGANKLDARHRPE